MDERPFFIVGNPRSGTTLLRFMLASHPRLWVPSETGFVPYLRVSPDRKLSPAETARTCRRIGRLNRRWSDTAAATSAAVRQREKLRLGELLDTLYRRRMAGCDAARWGDKTPGYVLHMPLISRIFPSCQFIHLIRDGRDVTLSALAKWRHRFPALLYMDEYYLLRRWALSVRCGREAGAELGRERYLELRYEELALDPEGALIRTCAFLGEEFHPGMLHHEALARRVISPAGHVEVREPVSSARIERWRREMTPAALWEAERVAGCTLVEFGYELSENIKPSLTARSRLVLKALRYGVTRSIQRALDLCGFVRLNRGKRRRHSNFPPPE
jgi:hypothetical protein